MTLARRSVKSRSDTLLVASDCHPQTIEVIRTRCEPLGLEVIVGPVPAPRGRRTVCSPLRFPPTVSTR